jgi:hypothetical protein
VGAECKSIPPIMLLQPTSEQTSTCALIPHAPTKVSRKHAMDPCVICGKDGNKHLEPTIYLPFVHRGGVCRACFRYDIEKCTPCLVDLTNAIKAIINSGTKRISQSTLRAFSDDHLITATTISTFLATNPPSRWNDCISQDRDRAWLKRITNVIAHHSLARRERFFFCVFDMIVSLLGLCYSFWVA